MVRKYSFGKVFNTEAVVKAVKAEAGEMPYFVLEKLEDHLVFTYIMGAEDGVYGLGEQIRGINKRGHVYISNCADDPSHTEDKRSLYGVHNFLLVDGKEKFLVFFDTPEKIIFDIGDTDIDILQVIAKKDVDCYIVQGDSLLGMIKEFREIIGESYIPPRWAFGYQQCRWSYMNEDEIREVIKKHRELGIPLDAVYLDIDYMEGYKDFTVNESAFPEFRKFVLEMREQNVHLVPIIDAGVKIEKGYQVYEEGIENHYFCRDENGQEFTGAVWPGMVHFPDFLNPEARKWFGGKYRFLTDMGIEGFWNDMNEPAIFYSSRGLRKVEDYLRDCTGEKLDDEQFSGLRDIVCSVANAEYNYNSFYHHTEEGDICHNRLHNLYGYNMTRAAGEALAEILPDRRTLLFSRASYIGMHRYGGVWMGDNMSWWSHLLLNIKMLPSLNMCGFLYAGADIGGFGGDVTEDLLMRWLEFGVFVPLMRNHSAFGTRRQEVYRFKNIQDFRNIIEVRYGLLAYIYSEFMKAALENGMYAKPLGFVYEKDRLAKEVEDQLLIGESIMIAPVYTQNTSGRSVYLPEEMMQVKMRSLTDYDCCIQEQGHHYVEMKLNELVFYILPDHIVPFTTGGQSVEEIDFHDLKLFAFVKDRAEYRLYADDGITRDYGMAENVRIMAEKDGRVTASLDSVSVRAEHVYTGRRFVENSCMENKI